MPQRFRTQSLPGPPGYLVRWDDIVVNYPFTQQIGNMTDVIGNYGGENYLSYEKTETKFSTINGDVFPGGGTFKKYTCFDYAPDCARSLSFPSMASPSLVGFKSQAGGIASSSPGKPDIELPNFLFELKDVPDMLSHAYRRARELERAVGIKNPKKGSVRRAVGRYMSNPSNPAKDWLNYNFGWRPFMADMSSLSKLFPSVAERTRKLNEMTYRHISRTASLGSASESGSGEFRYDRQLDIFADFQQTRQITQWVSTNWKISEFNYQALQNNQAVQLGAALGLDIGVHHIWNAIPFTWLTDWFVDIGSIIEARQNRAGFQYEGGSTMTHTLWDLTLTPRAALGIPKCAPVKKVYEKKHRNKAQLSYASNITIPVFSGGQLATLSSLAVTRR